MNLRYKLATTIHKLEGHQHKCNHNLTAHIEQENQKLDGLQEEKQDRPENQLAKDVDRIPGKNSYGTQEIVEKVVRGVRSGGHCERV